ncbi:hydrolase [Bacillus sp. FJAT-49736]|uniref:hydrolase n=1 Tax=Bacillus sp. FJAT-49736 TaxID=2833582 RepID=UPI001BC92ADF|nr:hydrolase [Bacillus sp. FJAT-49736]MBS4173895.1 hydrolase [Bacillus sp. FJAT-49736]
MEANKHTYYVDLGSGEISRSRADSVWNFKIEATDEEITKLRQIFDSNYDADIEGFLRAHIPVLEYHHDRPNDISDENLLRAYQMLYELGDEDAKKHIDSIGILKDFTSK